MSAAAVDKKSLARKCIMVCVSISVLTAAETALRLERGESYQSSSIRARLTPLLDVRIQRLRSFRCNHCHFNFGHLPIQVNMTDSNASSSTEPIREGLADILYEPKEGAKVE